MRERTWHTMEDKAKFQEKLKEMLEYAKQKKKTKTKNHSLKNSIENSKLNHPRKNQIFNQSFPKTKIKKFQIFPKILKMIIIITQQLKQNI